jgi:aspartate aminotransferase
MIADRVNMIQKSGIRNMIEFARTIDNPINFSIGEPYTDIDIKYKNIAINEIKKGNNHYSETIGKYDLRKSICGKYKKKGINVEINNIMVTLGASGALSLALMSLLNTGDEVIIPDPYYNEYLYLPIICGGVVRKVSTYPDFEYSADRIKNYISKKTKVIIINNPANPTGKVIKKDQLIEIVELARKYGLYIISDEIYEDFIYENEMLYNIRNLYDRVIVISGLSKSFSMTGWRLGYLIASEDIVEAAVKMQQYLYICAPTPFQVAGAEAIADGPSSKLITEYKRKRDYVVKALQSRLEFVIPEGTFYIFPKLHKGNASDFCYSLARSQKVITVPGSAFSEYDTNFRISFSLNDEKLEEGCARVCKFLDNW